MTAVAAALPQDEEERRSEDVRDPPEPIACAGKRHRVWDLVQNNPTGLLDQDLPGMLDFNIEGSPAARLGVLYACGQYELAPTTGTPHYQCMLMCGTVKSMKQIVAAFKGCSARMLKWTPDALRDYCLELTKRAEFVPEGFVARFEYGQFKSVAPGRGKRSDLLDVKRKIDDGCDLMSLWNCEETFGTMVRFNKGLHYYHSMREMQRMEQTTCVVYWGPPGSGKTSRALKESEGKSTFWMSRPGPGQTAWMDGYDGQEVIILDEFYGWLTQDMLCRMIDRTPYQVQLKGGWRNFKTRHIIFTSNKSPYEWYKETQPALLRRLKDPIGKVVYVDYSDAFPDPFLGERMHEQGEIARIPPEWGRPPVVPRVCPEHLPGSAPAENIWAPCVNVIRVPASLAPAREPPGLTRSSSSDGSYMSAHDEDVARLFDRVTGDEL